MWDFHPIWRNVNWETAGWDNNTTSWQYYKKGFKHSLCKEKGLSCFDKTLQPWSAETLSRWPSHSPLLSLSVKRSPLATQSINTNLALHASHSRLLLFAPPQSQSKHTQPFPPTYMRSKCARQFYDYGFVINSINVGSHWLPKHRVSFAMAIWCMHKEILSTSTGTGWCIWQTAASRNEIMCGDNWEWSAI